MQPFLKRFQTFSLNLPFNPTVNITLHITIMDKNDINVNLIGFMHLRRV